MSSQRGGKARDKRSHRNKPYERRQSLLGRLTDSVSRLLPESWVPGWLQEAEEEPQPGPSTATARRNHLNAAPPAWNQTHAGGIELGEDEDGRLMADAGGGGGGGPPVHAAPAAWAGARSSAAALEPPRTVLETARAGLAPTRSAPEPRPPLDTSAAAAAVPGLDESMARKRRRRQQHRDDDSELSDDSGPAPAAASSSGAAAGQERAQPQPSALGAKRPRFNASALNASLQEDAGSTSLNRSGASVAGGGSPFYPGPTVYGGAANHRRLRVPPPTSIGPYQVRPRVVSARPAAGSEDQPAMSSTARRILSVLEGMSTPVTDARRAPLDASGTLLDCSLPGRRRPAGVYGAHGARLGRRRADQPPVHRVLSPVRVTVEPNRSRTAVTPAPAAAAGTAQQDAASRRVTFSGEPTPVAAGGAGGKMRRQKESRHYSSRPDAPDDEQPSPEPLPDVSLPFTNIAPFTLSTSTPKVVADAEKRPPAAAAAAGPGSEFKFSSPQVVCVASAGLVNGLPESADDLAFEFSAPASVGGAVSAEKPGAGAGSGASAAATGSWGAKFAPAAGSWTCDTCMVTNKPDASKCVACQTPGGKAATSSAAAPAKATPAPPITSSWGDKFKPTAGTWSCDTCMVSNKPDADKCIACQSPCPAGRTASSPAKSSAASAAAADLPAVSSWGGKFAPAAGSWTCDTCMVTNKPDASKCVACQTPGGPAAKGKATPAKETSTAAPAAPVSNWGDKFKPAAGEWSCSACMLSNKPTATTCIACETPKPAASDKPAAKASPAPALPAASWGDKFKVPAGQWSCDTCMLSNKPEANKCAACETPNPSAKAESCAAGTKPAAEVDWECSTCLVRNKPAVSKCAACESPRPDASAKESEPNKFGTGGFSFGFGASKPAAETGKAPDSAGFTFGGNKSDGAKSSGGSGGFTFGVTATSSTSAAAPAGGFSFGFGGAGAAAADGVTSGDGAAKPPAAPAVNFNSGSPSTAGSLKRKQPTEQPAEKPVPELKTGNIMDLLNKPLSTSETKPDSEDGSKSGKPANGEFSFGAPVKAPAAAAFTFGVNSQASDGSGSAKGTTPAFKFGSADSAANSLSDASKAVDKPPPMFSLGAKDAPASEPATGFAFGLQKSAASTNLAAEAAKAAGAPEKTTAGFTFGSKTTGVSGSLTDGVSFGAKAPSSEQTPSGFSFGAKTSEASTAPTAAFSFGSKTSTTTEKPNAGFSFGSKPADGGDKPAATFSFASGAAAAAKPADKPAGFSFGSGATAAAKSAGAAFVFGAGASSESSAPAPAPASTAASAAPATFSFGSQSSVASDASMGSAGVSKPSSGGFSFGATAATTAAGAPSAVFAFGATSNGPATKKTATDGAEKPAVFQFGSAAPAPAPAAAAASPFGAAASPAPAAPFAFGAKTAPSGGGGGGMFTFGGSAAPAAPSATFSFGSKPAAPAPAARGGAFAFGASSSTPAAAAASPFGAAAGPAAAPAFGQATPQQPSAGFPFGANSTPSFNFGQQAAAAAPAPAGGAGIFRFGAPTDGTAPPAAPAAPTLPAPGQPPAAGGNPFSVGPRTVGNRVIRTARRKTVRK